VRQHGQRDNRSVTRTKRSDWSDSFRLRVQYLGLGRRLLLPMSKASIRSWCALVLVWSFALATAASAENPGLEYRFKARDGLEFKWRDGKGETLDRQPFMVAADFGNAIAIKSTNPKLPGGFEIDLVHNTAGKQKYRATTNADRGEEFCVVFNDCFAVLRPAAQGRGFVRPRLRHLRAVFEGGSRRSHTADQSYIARTSVRPFRSRVGRDPALTSNIGADRGCLVSGR
jgi:hypothetical protein